MDAYFPMKRKPLLLPNVAVSAIVALSLYWHHWIQVQRASEKNHARALIAKRSSNRQRAYHPAPLP